MQLDASAFVTHPEIVRILEGQSRSIPCDFDRVLFRQGETPAGLYMLHKGAATLSTNSLGSEFAISLQTTVGSLLGLPALLSRQPHLFTVVAHRGAHLSFIHRDEFSALVQSDPQLSLKLVRALAEEAEATRRAILDRVDAGEQWEALEA